MWHVPENALLRVLPFALVAALSLWGLIAPGSNWRLLWGWQKRFQHVAVGDRDSYVRRHMIAPLVLSVILGLMLLFV